MKTSIIIQNLKCGGCANTIISTLSKIQNVKNVMVDLEASSVSFESENPEINAIIKSKLKELGYPSIEADNTLISKVKSYISCASGNISKS